MADLMSLTSDVLTCRMSSKTELITCWKNWHFLNKFRVTFWAIQIKVGSVNQEISCPVAVYSSGYVYVLDFCKAVLWLVKALMSSKKHVNNQQKDTFYIQNWSYFYESQKLALSLLHKQTVSCETSTVSLWRQMKYLDESHIWSCSWKSSQQNFWFLES